MSWDPPGTVQGPLLFVICINDMPDEIIHSHLYLFADDTKLFKAIHNITDCELLQEDLEREQEWTDQAQSELHPDRFKHMGIRPTNIPHTTFKYYLSKDLAPLQSTLQEKDIGVIIDQDLSFNKHIAAKINKANFILGIINNTFDYTNKEVMLTLFKSLVRPHIEFANQVWAPYLIKHITAIENVQRRATKTIPGLKDLNYEQRLRHINLPSLSYRRIRGDMIENLSWHLRQRSHRGIAMF